MIQSLKQSNAILEQTYVSTKDQNHKLKSQMKVFKNIVYDQAVEIDYLKKMAKKDKIKLARAKINYAEEAKAGEGKASEGKAGDGKALEGKKEVNQHDCDESLFSEDNFKTNESSISKNLKTIQPDRLARIYQTPDPDRKQEQASEIKREILNEINAGSLSSSKSALKIPVFKHKPILRTEASDTSSICKPLNQKLMEQMDSLNQQMVSINN